MPFHTGDGGGDCSLESPEEVNGWLGYFGAVEGDGVAEGSDGSGGWYGVEFHASNPLGLVYPSSAAVVEGFGVVGSGGFHVCSKVSEVVDNRNEGVGYWPDDLPQEVADGPVGGKGAALVWGKRGKQGLYWCVRL